MPRPYLPYPIDTLPGKTADNPLVQAHTLPLGLAGEASMQ